MGIAFELPVICQSYCCWQPRSFLASYPFYKLGMLALLLKAALDLVGFTDCLILSCISSMLAIIMHGLLIGKLLFVSRLLKLFS